MSRRNGVLLLAAVAVAIINSLTSARADEPRIDDPMRPFARDEAADADGSAPRDFVLTAVLVSPDRRIAVINGQVRREGDEVAGARITRIEARKVHLSREGRPLAVVLESTNARESTNDGDSGQ